MSYVLIFIYTTVYFGQPFSTLTVENMQYAVFNNKADCVSALPSMSAQFKHKLLTEFQAVPLFMPVCQMAYVHNVDLLDLKFKIIERKVSDEELSNGL
jgi:hypothetical protein